MRIAQVDLENVKSYQRESVVFTPGTNAICGQNGAGKSTVLEAIGFAIFDYLPTIQDQFVREGEKVATVTVHLVDRDGRTYHVVRKCGSYSQHYVYDPEIDQKLVDGKSDTMAWLNEFLGVEDTVNPSVIFRDAVGVPQGLLTAAFLETPGRRKDVFNPLLRVDEYERVWAALREPGRYLEQRIHETDKRIAGLEAEVKALPGLEERVTDLAAAVAADEVRRDEVASELADLAGRKEALEAVRARLDELKQSVVKAEGEVKTLDARLADTRAAVERARQAQAVVAETEDAHAAYTAARSSLDQLETERDARDRLKETLQGHRTDLALARQTIERLQGELEAVAAAEAEMAALEPQVAQQEETEAALTDAERAARQLADRQKELAREKERLAALEARQVELEKGLAERAATQEEIETLREQSAALADRRENLVARIGGMETEQERLAEQSADLEAVEAAQCPLCEGPLTPEHRAELLERNQAEMGRLEQALTETRADLRDVEKDQVANEKALRDQEERLADLPRPAEAEDLAERVAAQQEVVTAMEAAVTELTGAPDEVDRLTASLEALGDPRRDHQRAADVAGRRPALEKDLASAEEQIAALTGQVATVEEELAAYVDLDERIEAQRAALAAHEPGHQRYLEHVREAQALEERQEKAAALETELEMAHAKRDQLVAERDDVAAEYDAEAYAQVTATYTDLREEAATLEERLRQHREQLADAQAEIERLTGVQAELADAQAQVQEYAALLTLLEQLRRALRDAGPKVTRALVEVISFQAARLYADIMADHTARLRWTEEYGIELVSGGRKRTFAQLSGGEQMAAALAVRLALLKEVSEIDVAFFDEPTANLDDHRRDNLARQILDVKGFSQLFVISHDDTFEQDTDNVVRVVKEDGTSRVLEV
jgi:exonuclease SbcC